MTGTSRELTISHGAQFPAQCLLGDDDAEFLDDPLAEVDDPPEHDAMHGRDRAALEYRGERRAVRAVKTRRMSGRPAINQPFRPMGDLPMGVSAVSLRRTSPRCRARRC